MRPVTTIVLLSALAPSFRLVAATSYDMVKEYAGTSFFDDWIFYNNFDNLTNGVATFVSSSVAKSAKLAYVDPATNNAIIKVDNTSAVEPPNDRNSVRITTKDRYSVGSVWIADMLHVPFGCSVWPAWWSQALDWPTGGEIDTFEGVNLVTQNQMSLHTEPGCTQASPNQSSTLINSTDCSFQANANQGCTVTVPSTQSYGAGFAQAGGGVFVTEFAASGISVWFFPRSSVPSTLSSNASNIDTSTFGLPVANWPSGGCSVSQFFEAQSLIFDITLCGDFAGKASVFAQTCSGDCVEDWVRGPPSNFDDAYFEVGSVRVYGASGMDVVVPGSGARARGGGVVWAAAVAAGVAVGVWVL